MAAALCLVSNNVREAQQADQAAQRALQDLESSLVSQENAPDAEQSEPEHEPEQPVPAYLLDPTMEMPTIPIDGHDYIGTIEIPALELSLPVMSEWSYPNLKLSPCRFEGSAYLGDLIIAAHNYRSHFGGLKDLVVGDDVIFTDADGNVFRYQVTELETVGGNDLETLESGDWDLTLFTCTPARTTRVVVRCESEQI